MSQAWQDDRRMLGEVLLAVADQLREIFTRAAAAEGLTFVEGRALRLALIHGRQSTLVDVLGVAPSRISALLRTLERRGLVTRRAANGDRRRRDLSVTPAGHDVLALLLARLDDHSPLMTTLTAAERETLYGLLVRLLDGPPRADDAAPASRGSAAPRRGSSDQWLELEPAPGQEDEQAEEHQVAHE